MNAPTPEPESRREFLRLFSLGGGLFLGGMMFSGCGSESSGGSSSAATISGGPPPPPPPPLATYTVLKLSTRKRNACNACKGHAQNMLFTTLVAVNANRAHGGCNCKVKNFVISNADYTSWFGSGQTSHDLRT